MANTDLPILQQRRIEANIIKPIYEEMVERLGKAQASEILRAAITRDAIQQGQTYAKIDSGSDDGGDGDGDGDGDGGEGDGTTLQGFHALLPQWKANGALEVEMLAEADDHVHYNVTRCKYAEMYKEMGLAEIGHILSCGRDGTFCTGYNPNIKLDRSQTIMQGADHCDFRYRWEEEK
ncbi:MAG: 2-amino-thiazoline-4-carboxylic acid hydrolase [Rhizobiaceae bacterium]|nr:2-amino-thiazoline-4-carboxylic acid hydrolase [Rhizobiaceae bacterium]